MRWAALALLVSGCAYLRPVPAATETEVLVSRGGSCVVVLLPGLGDAPGQFAEHGFVEALAGDAARCDVRVVDAHFGYYREAVIVERLAEVLRPLRLSHAQVWLVGVSLGGYGAALTARAHPELVDGLILISPFLGVPRAVRPVVARIEAVGGIDRFEAEVHELSRPQRHFVEVEPLWGWLASTLRDERGPPIHLAWGADDGFAWKHRALAGSAGLKTALERPGGHDWRTFAALFREVLKRAPLGS